MAFRKIIILLAIPEDVYKKIPDSKKAKFRDAVRDIKQYAVRINEGSPNEEMTITATHHLCRHDEGGECDPEEDI